MSDPTDTAPNGDQDRITDSAARQPPESLLQCGTCKDWFTVAKYARHPCVEKWKRDRRGR